MRQRRDEEEPPLMTAARWIIIASFWMFGMGVAAAVIMMWILGAW